MECGSGVSITPGYLRLYRILKLKFGGIASNSDGTLFGPLKLIRLVPVKMAFAEVEISDYCCHAALVGYAGECLGRGGSQEEQPVTMRGELPETKTLVEGDGPIVLGFHDDCEHGDGAARVQDAAYGVGQQEFADSKATCPVVAGKPADEGCRNGVVARQLAGDLVW